MKSFIPIVALIGCALALPIQDDVESPISPPIQGNVESPAPANLIHGDMLLYDDQQKALFTKRNKQHRNGSRNPARRWPNATVCFRFTEDVGELFSIKVN